MFLDVVVMAAGYHPDVKHPWQTDFEWRAITMPTGKEPRRRSLTVLPKPLILLGVNRRPAATIQAVPHCLCEVLLRVRRGHSQNKPLLPVMDVPDKSQRRA
jgi:hypothetical protein